MVAAGSARGGPSSTSRDASAMRLIVTNASARRRPAVRVQINPTALAAAGFSTEDVRTAITQANVNLAKGNLDGPARATAIDAKLGELLGEKK